jgi:predicted dehydrogenase
MAANVVSTWRTLNSYSVKTMRFGLVGAGKIGKLRAAAVRQHPGGSLAAVFDPQVDSRTKVAAEYGAKACASLDELLQVPMDAVIVASPIHQHVDACLMAFAKGLHVLCEKPLTHSADTSRKLVRAAHASKRVLGVGFNLRYYPAFRFMKDVIESGRIGELDHVRIFGGHEGLPKFKYEWEYRAPDSGGGAMWDVGIHMTDLARYYIGDITEVYGMMSERVWKVPGSEDNAIAVFRNANGIPASYQATWIEWKGYGIVAEAYGDRGMVSASYAPMRNLLITQDKPGGTRRTERLQYRGIEVREKLRSWQTTALQSFVEELKDFEALTRGESGTRIADGIAGLRSIEVADAVRQSAVSGEAVHLPPSSAAA